MSLNNLHLEKKIPVFSVKATKRKIEMWARLTDFEGKD